MAWKETNKNIHLNNKDMHFNMSRMARMHSKHSELYLSTGGDVNQTFGGHRQVAQLKRSTGKRRHTK